VLNVSDIAREDTSHDRSSIAFTRNGKRWTFTQEASASYFYDGPDCSHGKLSVSIDGEEVMVLTIVKFRGEGFGVGSWSN
jgi:hypothetical protein